MQYIQSFLASLNLFLIFGTQPSSLMINGTELVIYKGDILKSNSQAIVNAANPELRGRGVCGAIFKAAGWGKLQDACDQYPLNNGVRCAVGSSVSTDSFDLQHSAIRTIIHAVGPDCRIIRDPVTQDKLLTDVYMSALQLSEQLHIESISFPFISSGIYAFPKERAATIALQTVKKYIQNNKTGIKKIKFVLFFQDDFDLFNNCLTRN